MPDFAATHPCLAIFRCPLCASDLIIDTKVWHCTGQNLQARQHSFDVAKQGYVNLLPVQQKKSKQPGDSEASIAARQRFLQMGGYQPLRDGLVAFCDKVLTQIVIASNLHWLDVGCGEGYYTKGFLRLQPKTLVALDISKPAVVATAKRLKNLSSAAHRFSIVGSASQVPLSDSSIHVISSVFSPILPEEFARLLSPGGLVLIAKPAPNHLFAMREGLFDTVIAHDSDKFIDELAPFFTLIDETRITYDMALNPEQLADLVTMTPYTYRAKLEKRQALLQQCHENHGMTLTADFILYAFQKR